MKVYLTHFQQQEGDYVVYAQLLEYETNRPLFFDKLTFILDEISKQQMELLFVGKPEVYENDTERSKAKKVGK